LQELLEGGANTVSAGVYAFSALHQAAYYGRQDLCRLLLDWEAKLDPVDE
jgi:ankyrin repeat protein